MPIAMPLGLAAAFGATEVNYERRTQHFRAGRGGAEGARPALFPSDRLQLESHSLYNAGSQ